MSSNNKAIKSYQGFEEGSYAARKGRLCLIKKIHFEMHPPSVTVQMIDTDTEVGTEFDRLKHVKSWFCDMCTAQNGHDNSLNKCSFCGMKRSFKEKITIKQEINEEIKSTQNEKENENKKEMESPQLSESAESEEIDQVQQKETEKKEESEEDEESEDEEDEYEYVKDNDCDYYDDQYYDNPHKNKEHYYQNGGYRNNINRNRMNRNPFNQEFGFDGWNTSPFFNRFFM